MRTSMAVMAALLMGCGTGDRAPVENAGATTTTAVTALELRSAETAWPKLAKEAVVLDVDRTRVLVGTPEWAPPNADPELLMRVQLFDNGAFKTSPLDVGPVAQARLLPAGRLLVTTPEFGLIEHDGIGGSRVRDTDVHGAVGASLDGQILVYCKGTAPEFEVFRLDGTRSSKPLAVTSDMAPTWSPAVSEDGSRVVFVSAKTGVPALWLREGDEAPRQITNRNIVIRPGIAPEIEPFPAALSPTRYAVGAIVFEGERGVYAVSENGTRLGDWPGRKTPFWTEPGRRLGMRAGEGISLESLATTQVRP